MNTKPRSWLRSSLLSVALLLTMGAGCASAAATLKQFIGTCQTGGASSCTITPGVAIVSGDALVVIVGGIPSANTIASVTATGHTFTVLDSIGGASQPWIGDAYECSAVSGTPTFTITMTAAGGAVANMYEVQGNATTACIDGHTGQAQTSPGTGTNAVTSGTIAVATNGEFFLGGTASGCCTPPTVLLGTSVAWTNLQANNDTQIQVSTEEFAQGTAASLAATFTVSPNTRSDTLIVGIAPAGGGATARPCIIGGGLICDVGPR